MKRILLALFLVFACMSLEAATVKGRVYNSEYDEGEPFATIRLYQGKNDKPIATIVSDVDGYFELEIPKSGNYEIEISALGKTAERKQVTVSMEQDLEIGDITLKDDAKNLNEVVVTAQRPLVQMKTDEMVYNVEADSDSKTYTLLELLRKVPMVTVDGQDNITVNGSSNFQVYVDGKPSLLFSGNPSQIFKAMPASSVQNIEVVTNPGARYDAEGVGGVINLVMNKTTAGAANDIKAYNVTINLRGGNRGLGGNIYATGQVGKFTASLNLIQNYMMPGRSQMITDRKESELTIESTASSKPKLPFTMGNLNLQYDIDSVSTLSASFSINRFANSIKGTTNTLMEQNSVAFYNYLQDSHNKNERLGLNGSLSFSRYFGTEKNNQLNITYQISSEKQDNDNTNDFMVLIPENAIMDARKSESDMKTLNQIVLADFTSKFRSNSISVGVKGTFRNATANNDYYINSLLDTDGSLYYKNNNRIGAIYGEYAFSKNIFNLKAGLRYEYTWESISYADNRMDSYKSRYGNIVPSGSIGFNLKANSNIGINYNMRISRPGISYLNPYVNQADPTQLTYGNPDLDIEKTHNVSLVYNFFSPMVSLNATLSNAYTGNGIEQYSFMEDGILNTTYGNIVKKNQTGLNIFLNLRLGIKTAITLNGGMSYLNIKSDELEASNKGLQSNFMVGLQQTLPWEIRGNVFMIMSTKNRTLQGWTTGFRMLALNFSKSFLEDKIGVSLGFNTGLYKGGKMHIDTYTSTPNFTNKTSIKIPMMAFNVGVTLKFGSKVRTKDIRSKELDNDYIDTRSNMESISNSPAGGGM